MPSRTKKAPSRKRSTRQAIDPRSYQIVVRWSDEDECYLAEAPALQGCMTHGSSPSGAIKSCMEAMALWLGDAIKHGDPIPTPARVLSGKMTLRMPISLHQRIAEAAQRDGVSINQWVVTKIAAS